MTSGPEVSHQEAGARKESSQYRNFCKSGPIPSKKFPPVFNGAKWFLNPMITRGTPQNIKSTPLDRIYSTHEIWPTTLPASLRGAAY